MRRWKRYRSFQRSLRDIGYSINEHVLDAQHINTPQTRRRLFLICHLGSAPALRISQAASRRTAREILDAADVWPMSPLFKAGRSSDTIARYLNGLQHVGTERQFLLVYYGTDGCGGWQRIDKPLRTITTVDRFALIDESHSEPMMRMLQVPELRRAMGFGDDYTLPGGTRRERIKLLGNAVCPTQMQAIVSALLSTVSQQSAAA
jgi:DNA (cytosine-5)-methyltransferase 1